MPIPTSYGLLVYRYNSQGTREYLLVHPSGYYNVDSPYYIPKGQPEPDETPEETALRETFEETGVQSKIVADLGTITYKCKRKKVYAFLAEFESGPVESDGTVTWSDWENDVKEFFTEAQARELLRPEMITFLDLADTYFKHK